MYKYWATSFVYEKNKRIAYFFSNNINGFYEWDIKHNIVKQVSDMSDVAWSGVNYDPGICVDKYLYYPPRIINEFAVFDIESRKLSFCKLFSERLICRYKDINVWGNFVVSRGDTVYFVNRKYPIVAKIDTKTGDKTEIEFDMSEYCIELAHNNNEVYYFPTPNMNRVYMFNTENEDLSYVELEEYSELKISSCFVEDNRLLITGIGENAIYIYDLDKKTTEKKELVLPSVESTTRRYIKKVCDNYYVLPLIDFGIENNIYCLDKGFNVVSVNNEINPYGNRIKLGLMEIDGKEIMLLIEKRDKRDFNMDIKFPHELDYVRINLEEGTVEKIIFPEPVGLSGDALNSKILNDSFSALINEQSYLYEHGGIELEDYIKYLVNK